jgi:hypothetical protein
MRDTSTQNPYRQNHRVKTLMFNFIRSATGLSASSESTKTPALFPRTDPAVDGEECIRDCEACTVRYPKSFKIDETDELYGMVKGWATHLVVGTGKSDWKREVEDEEGSVMEAVGKADKPENGVSSFLSLRPPC